MENHKNSGGNIMSSIRNARRLRLDSEQADGIEIAPPREPEAPQYAPEAPAEAEDDATAKLQNLAALHTQGVLTNEEFAAAKAKILGI